MREKLGIENLKIAIVAAITLGEKLEEKTADDGKISLSEALSVGVSSFDDVVRVIRLGSTIKDEFIDLSDDEAEELIELVKNELDLKNHAVEDVIEKAIEFLVSLEGLITSIKELK